MELTMSKPKKEFLLYEPTYRLTEAEKDQYKCVEMVVGSLLVDKVHVDHYVMKDYKEKVTE